MENKKVVVALGRNAFSESFPKQQERVKAAAKAIADLVEEKYEVIITHSNGPQVGMIQTAMTEYSRLDPDRTVAPMSICGAMSQGYIGFDLQNAIRTELLHRGIYKPVSTIITQVRVDPFDRAFNAPSKVIGRLMTKEEAENEKIPLCERLTFASIYQSNLDEFFMVRVGSLVDQMLLTEEVRDNKTKMTPQEQLTAILAQVRKLNQRNG